MVLKPLFMSMAGARFSTVTGRLNERFAVDEYAVRGTGDVLGSSENGRRSCD